MLKGTEILTCAEMRAIEQAAINSGAVTGLQLMERAGRAVTEAILARWPKPGQVTVLCGPGNNGGDGYVVARLLHDSGWQVRVLGMDNIPGPDAAEMKRRWCRIGEIDPLTLPALEASLPADLAVDALFGTGMTRPLGSDLGRLLQRLGGYTVAHRVAKTPVVAVDAPSGLCMDSGVMIGRPRGVVSGDRRADMTISFHRPRIGHLIGDGPAYCGQLEVADIGLTDSGDPLGVVRQASADAAQLRKYAQGHKFDHGHALIIAGGISHGGAARLAARAALRVGAGLVTLAPPGSALIAHAGPPDALMRHALNDANDLTEATADSRLRALAIGPGCGLDRAEALMDAALACQRPCVLDADALTALSRRATPFAGLHDACVLTPHMGEFARLFPELAAQLAAAPDEGPALSKLDAARAAAARSGAVVVLKGPDTVMAEPGGRAVIHSAFDIPWLATAGAGDVLAGIIAGLLARGLPPLDAAGTGALIHAQAARRFGPGLIADDLPDQIPGVFRDMNL